MKDFVANRVFETTDILKEAVLDGLYKLAKSTDRIKSIGKRSWSTLTNQNETSDDNKTCSDGANLSELVLASRCCRVFNTIMKNEKDRPSIQLPLT